MFKEKRMKIGYMKPVDWKSIGRQEREDEIIELINHLKYELELRDWIADELIKQIKEQKQ